ncbi:helix-turn-helix transcriptional regulator [Streptomyces sp. NPDC005355]|uniref:helix-turn-helix transcriptional regulator n=1 Tax=Streptomyces sp. NPDC005355 TaxID=3157038 RepID=UPI0033BAD9FA
MRLEEAIGWNIAQMRAQQELSQADLGEALGVYLEKPWSRQAVHSAEKGKRAFTAAELVAFSLVLQCELPDLLTPHGPARAGDIELPNGSVPAMKIAEVVAPEAPEDWMRRTNVEMLRHLVPMLTGSLDTLQLLQVHLKELLADAEEREARENSEAANPLVKEEMEARAKLSAALADALARGSLDQERLRSILGFREKTEAVEREVERGDG